VELRLARSSGKNESGKQENRKGLGSEVGRRTDPLPREALYGERGGCEVQEKAILKIRCLKIAPANREVDVFERTDRFQLYNDLILDEKVETMFADLVILIEKRDRFLSNELNATERELYGERLFVNRLKKSGTKLAVDANSCRNDALGRFPIPQLPSCFPAFLIHI
jgi:hypothetical protein